MSEGIFRRRRLPHWDVDDAIYFVTACLEGSIPAHGLTRLNQLRAQLDRRPRPPDLSIEHWEIHKHKLLFAEFDKIIDREPAVRHLASPILAEQVQDNLFHFAGNRYDLLAFVVMPSHFHWLFHPRAEWVHECLVAKPRSDKSAIRTPRQRIVKSINGFSARQCNGLLSRSGQFWQDECYDHVVRDEDELLRIIAYIENNPVKAGLAARPEDWQWSSAHTRAQLKIAYGEPFPPRVGQTFLTARDA